MARTEKCTRWNLLILLDQQMPGLSVYANRVITLSDMPATVDKDALMLSTMAGLFGGEPMVLRLLIAPSGRAVPLQYLMCSGCLFCFQHF